MSRQEVGREADFEDGVPRIVSVGGRQIGIVRWADEWFAVRNVCPHVGAPLCDGGVRPLLTERRSWSADLTVDPTRPIIMCPWHRWEFDLRSGECLTGRGRARTYPVRIEDGRVLVEIGRSAVRA